MEAIFFASHRLLPERVSAGIFGGVQAMAIAGEVPHDARAVHPLHALCRRMGGRATMDGMNALCPLLNGDNFNVPCEVIEAKYRLHVEQYSLISDSGRAREIPRRIGRSRRLPHPQRRRDRLGLDRSLSLRAPGLFGGGGSKRSRPDA